MHSLATKTHDAKGADQPQVFVSFQPIEFAMRYQQHGFTSVEDLKLARTSVAEGAIFVHKGFGGAGLGWRPFGADRVGRRGFPNKQKQKAPPTGGIFVMEIFLQGVSLGHRAAGFTTLRR